MPPIPFGGGSTVTLKPIDEEECDISDPYSVCSQVLGSTLTWGFLRVLAIPMGWGIWTNLIF